ncbi:hypothetical protein [Actinomadura luteofluorescens]|uniref:hypothetical protein n=1 Tax=Actinomadura luteofluorescens TaxID=46163 RepID=UPI003D8E12E7
MLSTSDRIGQMYWIDLGEGSADEYGAIPGADYLVVEHDGSYAQIYAALAEIHRLASAAQAKGEPPVVVVIDSMTAVWDLLKDWATERAKDSKSNKRKLAQDPNAEIKVSTNYWNDANSRHRKLMRLLMTFSGIALMTARGKDVAAMDESGQPVEGRKTYKVEGQKNLGYDSSCWIRLSRDERPLVVGCRSVHTGIRPGRDEPMTLDDDWTLESVIFDALRCDPAKAHVRDLVDGQPERTPEQIREEAVNAGTGYERMLDLYAEAQQLGYDSVTVDNERGQEELLLALIKRLGTARMAKSPATQNQRARLDGLFKSAGDFDDGEAQARYLSEITNRQVGGVGDLSAAEAETVSARLRAYIEQNTPPSGDRQPEPAGVAS